MSQEADPFQVLVTALTKDPRTGETIDRSQVVSLDIVEGPLRAHAAKTLGVRFPHRWSLSCPGMYCLDCGQDSRAEICAAEHVWLDCPDCRDLPVPAETCRTCCGTGTLGTCGDPGCLDDDLCLGPGGNHGSL